MCVACGPNLLTAFIPLSFNRTGRDCELPSNIFSSVAFGDESDDLTLCGLSVHPLRIETVSDPERFLAPSLHEASALPQFHVAAFLALPGHFDRGFVIASVELIRSREAIGTVKEIEPIKKVAGFRPIGQTYRWP